MAKQRMFHLSKVGYPLLTIEGQPLPFETTDEGDTFDLVATVKLKRYGQQGNTFQFQVQQVGFPGREKDLGPVGNRVRERKRKAGEA